MANRRWKGTITACMVLVAAPAWAQDRRTILIAEHAGLDSMLDTGKDAALAEALAMIPARIRELSLEIPELPPDVPAMANLVLGSIARSARMAVTWTDENQTGLWGYGVIVSVGVGDVEQAQQLDALVKLAMEKAEAPVQTRPSRTWNGMTDLVTPVGLVSFGPRHAASGWRYEILAGTVEDPDAPFVGWEAPDGGRNVMRLVFDPSGLEAALDMAEQLGRQDMPPEAADMLAKVRELNLVGPGAPTLGVTMSRDATGLHSRTVITDLWRYKDELQLSESSLDPAAIAVLPDDATMASIASGGWAWVDSMLEDLRTQGLPVDQFLDEFFQTTGVHLIDDVIATLGETSVSYTSLSTGGGSFASTVVLMSVTDSERLGQSLDKLSTFANLAVGSIPRAGHYVRLASWEHDDLNLLSLRAQGLPVPVEITLALTDDWLIAGLTPQGVIAAARHTTDRGGGVAIAEAVRAAVPRGKRLVGVSYMDAPWFAGSGYMLTQMLGTAIGSAVRSPIDPQRDPGMVVPLYHDLMAGVQPTVEVTYWDGEDMVIDSHMDGSMLVGTAAAMGVVKQIAPLIAAGVGAAMVAQRQGGMNPNWSRWSHLLPDDPQTLTWLARPELPLSAVQRAELALMLSGPPYPEAVPSSR